jgi:hypothetical protein
VYSSDMLRIFQVEMKMMSTIGYLQVCVKSAGERIWQGVKRVRLMPTFPLPLGADESERMCRIPPWRASRTSAGIGPACCEPGTAATLSGACCAPQHDSVTAPPAGLIAA